MWPAILAAVARLGAGAAARLGASGIARALVAAGRTAGPGVSRQVATRAAASGGSAAAMTAAVEDAHAAAGGFRVLENTKLGNAKALFDAIYGRTTRAVTPPGGMPALPGAPPVVNPAGGMATLIGAPPVVDPTRGMPTIAGAPPITPAAPAGGASSAPTWTGRAPAGGASPSLLDKTLNAWQQTRQTFDQARERFTPISERTAKMSLDERYARLESTGRLPSSADVSRHYGTPHPSREQVVDYGEGAEEKQRQKEISQSRIATAGQSAFSAGKNLAGALSGGLSGLTTPTGVVKLVAAAYTAALSLEKFGKAVSEGNRDLAQFNGRIADSFVRLDYAQLRNRQRMATATSGSTAFVNDQLRALMQELQPLKETGKTLLNTVAGAGVVLARTINIALSPITVSLKLIANIAEWFYGKGKSEVMQKDAKEFLGAIRDGKFQIPQNRKPNEGVGRGGGPEPGDMTM